MSAQVAIVMGSSSDAPIMAVTEETLSGLGIEHETRVLSAHRTPDEVRDWSRGLAGRGVKVVIAAAGGAAHLAGAVAAHQTLPVIGVPLALRSGRGMQLALPFGVFLGLSFLAVLFFGPTLSAWYLSLMTR